MRAKHLWLAISLAISALLAGCEKKDADLKQVVYKGPFFETDNVVTLLSDSARLHIRLTAPLEQVFDNSDRLYPKGAVVTIYDKAGKVIVNTIRGNWAKFDNAKQRYILRGLVKVANVPQQQTLATEELFYDRNKQQIFTDSAMFVRVQTPTEVLTGNGLTANQDFSSYRLFHPIGTFSIDQAKGLGQ